MEAKSLQWGLGLGVEKGEGGRVGRGGGLGESSLCWFFLFYPLPLKKIIIIRGRGEGPVNFIMNNDITSGSPHRSSPGETLRTTDYLQFHFKLFLNPPQGVL